MGERNKGELLQEKVGISTTFHVYFHVGQFVLIQFLFYLDGQCRGQFLARCFRIASTIVFTGAERFMHLNGGVELNLFLFAR